MSPRLLIWAIAAVLAVAVHPAPVLAGEWLEHRPPGAGYRIELPGRPQITTNDVSTHAGPIATTSAVVDRGGGTGFIASHNDYPAGIVTTSNSLEILDGVRRGQIGKRPVRSERRLTIAGYPAWHLVLQNADHRILVTRAVLVDSRLFQLVYIGPSGTENSRDVSRFFDSFALVNR